MDAVRLNGEGYKAFERKSVTERIIGFCFQVDRELGPGFNEKIYHKALDLLLDQKGI